MRFSDLRMVKCVRVSPRGNCVGVACDAGFFIYAAPMGGINEEPMAIFNGFWPKTIEFLNHCVVLLGDDNGVRKEHLSFMV